MTYWSINLKIRAALENSKPFRFIPNQTPLQITVTYCWGSPLIKGAGNATVFQGKWGANLSEIEQGLKQRGGEGKENKALFRFTSTALSAMSEIWRDEIEAQPLTSDHLTKEYIYLLPKTREEENERMIEALELALLAPEENAQLIEYIAEQCDFSYSQTEIEEASQLTNTPLPALVGAKKEAEQEASAAAASAIAATAIEKIELSELDLPPAVMARAVIEKLKKQRPAAQRAKDRQVQAAAASSNQRQLLSKEELQHQLTASSMPGRLAEQASSLLSGERLPSKRAEDKFFFEILSFQAKSSGSQIQKGNKSGSHHSIKLIKQMQAGGKSTFRAATLVNKHGIDPNRGHSLSVQQNKLLRLFTPLA